MEIANDNKLYISGDDFLKKYPKIYRNAQSSRQLVDLMKLTTNDYVYMKCQKDKSWTTATGKSKRDDKIFILKNIIDLCIKNTRKKIGKTPLRNLINDNIEINDNIKINDNIEIDDNIKINDNIEIDNNIKINGGKKTVDDNNNIENNNIENNNILPDILNLNDNEKFKDDNGNILDIETRGERDFDKVFFKAMDVSTSLNALHLINSLIRKTSAFKINIDYTYFYINKQKYTYLTYQGLLHFIFVSRIESVSKYIKWASKIVYTVQMGADNDKNHLIADMKGISYETVQKLFACCANAISCIYLTHLNTVQQLKTVMNINDTYPLDSIVCKCGFSKDFIERKNGHKSEFKKIIEHVTFQLLIYCLIDPVQLSQAESELKNFLLPYKFEWDNKDELYIIPKQQLNSIKTYFKTIGQAFSGHNAQFQSNVAELNKQILTIESDNNNLIAEKNHQIKSLQTQLLYEAELFKEQQEKTNLRHQYDLELFKEQLDKKDLVIQNLETQHKFELLQFKCKELETQLKYLST
jgi:hypothetical protein